VSRRASIALTEEEKQQYLRDRKTIILCSIDHHGYPHAVAMWFLAEGDTVLMTTYAKSQKIANIRRNPKVTLLAESGETYDTLKGVMIRGRAELVQDVDACVKLLMRIHEKMGGSIQPGIEEAMRAQARKRILIKVKPVHVSSWDHAKLGGVY
jgi:PPOX class probable F420-dependent enzyme